MDLAFQFVLLCIGLIFLWRMGERCVRYALAFSSLFGIQQFTVGFLIFAVSTGLPEISDAVVSSLNGVPELSLGDLSGSTTINMSFILGILILVGKEIEVSPHLRKKLIRTVGAMVIVFGGVLLFETSSFWLGMGLIGCYLSSFFWYQAGIPKTEASEEMKELEKEGEVPAAKTWISPRVDVLLKLALSLSFLLLASWMIVHAARNIARVSGVDLSLLGGTVVAIGSSFPELALEIHAIKQKKYSLALGDLFGSSLLNISLVLGLLMLLNTSVNLSYLWKVAPFLAAIFIWCFQKLVRKQNFKRIDGFIFLAIFGAYLVFSGLAFF